MFVLKGKDAEEASRMIFVDPGEKQFMEKLSAESLVTFAPSLEEETGADLMVTPLKLPYAHRFLKDHLEAGAVFVQRKSKHDLPASVVDRMSSSLARMRATGARPSQCILMFIGVLMCDADGNGIIDGQEIKGFSQSSFWVVQSSIDKWTERGGVYLNLSREGLFVDWLKMKEKHLLEFVHNKKKVVYDPTDPLMAPVLNDPLQELVLVKDWRKTLMSLPGIGPQRIEDLMAHMNSIEADVSLIQALMYLTDFEMSKDIPGIGHGTVARIREWFGLQDDLVELALRYPEIPEKELPF